MGACTYSTLHVGCFSPALVYFTLEKFNGLTPRGHLETVVIADLTRLSPIEIAPTRTLTKRALASGQMTAGSAGISGAAESTAALHAHFYSKQESAGLGLTPAPTKGKRLSAGAWRRQLQVRIGAAAKDATNYWPSKASRLCTQVYGVLNAMLLPDPIAYPVLCWIIARTVCIRKFSHQKLSSRYTNTARDGLTMEKPAQPIDKMYSQKRHSGTSRCQALRLQPCDCCQRH